MIRNNEIKSDKSEMHDIKDNKQIVHQSDSVNKKRNMAKKRLMANYNLSESESEKVLRKIEQRPYNSNQTPNSQDKLNKDYLNKNSNTSSIKINDSRINKRNKGMHKMDTSQSNGFVSHNNLTNDDNESKLKSQNVDSILSDIIPNYNTKIAIELINADLTFEVSDEKIDTIKEKVIKTIKKSNPKTFKIHAINDISFKIYKGEKVGIIGYNGAGKSTLLKVICGIYPLDDGEVHTFGNISPMLSLGAGFDYNYSGRRNIFFNGAVLGYEKEFLESKLDEIIEFSELGEYIDVPIKNYSSGMLSRLSFSIATAVEPDILIIDEVLGVGDATFSKKSRDKIRSIMDGETTVLLVSHSIAQIREICDKAIWVDKGKVREIGEVNKVCDHYLKDAEKASKEQLENIKLG